MQIFVIDQRALLKILDGFDPGNVLGASSEEIISRFDSCSIPSLKHTLSIDHEMYQVQSVHHDWNSSTSIIFIGVRKLSFINGEKFRVDGD